MLLRQIGLVLSTFIFLTPAFATQCPPADKVRNCHNDDCYFQTLAGWSGTIFYTDKGKPFLFQKERVDGREISCYYSYLEPETHKFMPPALVLRSTN